MGGKSTLLRQVCLAVILAQIGCYVPASSFVLSPVDRIFTRLGANDNIMAGRSTFLVELLDTAKILREATSHSLVILDELGRGTSTFDGMAIAHATLLHLLRRQRPLALFATHYRPLAIDCQQETGVLCRYLDCATDPDSRRVTFLYKLTLGISPKSYGMNVAAMAGLPNDLLLEASKVADHFEEKLSLSIKRRTDAVDTHRRTQQLLDQLCPPIDQAKQLH
jgi:DNA mismatch repair protein MSH6